LIKEFIITRIEPQKRNNKRVSIYLNGEYAFGLNLDIALKSNLKEGQTITKDFIDDILKKEEQSKANGYGLNLLTYRSRSSKEVADKMKLKGYDLDTIEKTIEFLSNYGYLNDYEFAQEYIRQKSKKYGSKRIGMELIEKGINKETIKELLSRELDEDYQYQRAMEIAKQKMNSYSKEDKQTLYRRLGGYLQRKGFDYQIITRVLDQLIY